MPKQENTLEVGLALSGGGFRASLFSLGALWRLNELGWLPKLSIVTSVSGGSITAGVLGLAWKKLRFEKEVATNFRELVASPLQHFCTLRIDVAAGLEGLTSVFDSIAERVAEKYADELFGKATLQDLPGEGEGPRFVLYATSLQTGASVRMSRKYLADYRVGRIDAPKIPLATAVGASSAFPPVLSPVVLETRPTDWKETDGADLYSDPSYREKLILADGGVYDNMGLEAIWDRCKTVLVSDAGAPLGAEAHPHTTWTKQLMRVLNIVTDQTRALRKRELVDAFQEGKKRGTYWGVTTRIADYGLADALVKDSATTASLQEIRTRLNPFSDEEQGRLINWGYALADAAMRRYVLQGTTAPTGALPFPKFPL